MSEPLCPCLCGVRLAPSSFLAPYSVCPACKSGWTDIQPGEHWDEAPPSEEQRAFWASRASQWQVALGPGGPGRVLDIGCGYGDFVGWASEQGWDAWGTEPSAAARRHTAAPADRVVTSLEEIQGLFDVITLWDVLEHVPAPSELVHELMPRLASDGRLFVCSPDFAALRLRWPFLRRDPQAFSDVVKPHEHCTQFTATGLTMLLERCGLTRAERLHPPLANGPIPLRSALGRLPLLRTGLFVVAISRD